MNQQRARRFRSAMDAKEADEKKAEFQTLLRQQNRHGDTPEQSVEEVVQKTWDSNVITPGTPFMFILAQSVRYWVQWKLNTDPAWAQLKVIISDASVPGEGEHKIMQYIRSQRSDPAYDPNTRHVMYGLDADLIMLGIATHEPHYRVLREDVFLNDAKAKTCKLCGRPGHYAENCRGQAKEKAGAFDEKAKVETLKPFVWLNVPILREYLGAEMFVPGQTFRFDLERALDDWVFMCFFVGNDFLPHLPSLEIREDGIDKLIAIWRDNIPIMGGYLTCDGKVDLARAQIILQGLAKQEDAIFRRRKETEDKEALRNQRRNRGREARDQDDRSAKRRRSSPDYTKGSKVRADARVPTGMQTFEATNFPTLDYNSIVNRGAVDKALTSNKSAAAVLKEQMLAKKAATETPNKGTTNNANGTPGSAGSVLGKRTAADMEEESSTLGTPASALGRRQSALMDDDTETDGTPGRNTPVEKKPIAPFDPNNPPPDTVRLWEEGYADRYYEQKFHVAPNDLEFRHKVAQAYVEGLSWVLLYYFQGCPSWTWYYPYHYAPFAADFVDIDKKVVKFDKGTPFKPYEQLMGVLPAASNHAIPTPFHSLMTDADSDIVDFYPEEFELDMNGAKQPWKAVVLLPFIDEKRLLKAMGTKYPLLTADEHARNERGQDALLISDQNSLYEQLVLKFYSKKSKDAPKTLKLSMQKFMLAGEVTKNEDFLPNMDLIGPQPDIKLDPEIDDDRSMSVFFTMPPPTHVHKSMLFPGVVLPAPVLDSSDLHLIASKARTSGRDFGGAPLYDNTRRDPNNNHRGGRISYAADRPPLNGPPPIMPPPNQWPPGMPPPPPPNFGGQNGYNRGPPPPPPGYQGYQGYDQGQYGGGSAHNGNQQYNAHGQYGGRQHSDGHHQGQNRGHSGRDNRNGYGNGGGYNQNGYGRR
jgi:5'-3' exoribonuclease 2